MREFKFRAYHPKTKQTLHFSKNWSFCIEYGQLVFGVMEREFQGIANMPDACWQEEEWILMQYTGLKDKNGKEIYEGDIIFQPSWWWGPGEVILNTGKCGPCEGDSVMSYVCRGKGGHISYNIWNGKEVEVIGNIYENPELIKKSLAPDKII